VERIFDIATNHNTEKRHREPYDAWKRMSSFLSIIEINRKMALRSLLRRGEACIDVEGTAGAFVSGGAVGLTLDLSLRLFSPGTPCRSLLVKRLEQLRRFAILAGPLFA